MAFIFRPFTKRWVPQHCIHQHTVIHSNDMPATLGRPRLLLPPTTPSPVCIIAAMVYATFCHLPHLGQARWRAGPPSAHPRAGHLGGACRHCYTHYYTRLHAHARPPHAAEPRVTAGNVPFTATSHHHPPARNATLPDATLPAPLRLPSATPCLPPPPWPGLDNFTAACTTARHILPASGCSILV